jgi:hypothetical protein
MGSSDFGVLNLLSWLYRGETEEKHEETSARRLKALTEI